MDQYKFETLRVTRHTNVLHVELNRPKRLNAMNPTFWSEFRRCFELIRADTETYAVVVSGGDSKGFTAGLDLSDGLFNLEGDVARVALRVLPKIEDMQESFTAIEKCDKPVISAVHGFCIGGGIDLITACDIRLCSAEAVFSVKEVDIGLAADIGTLQRLPKVVGNHSWIRDICFTARNFGAAEALQFGLVSKILPSKTELVDEALKMAAVIAGKSPVATVGTKHVLNYSREHTVEEGLKHVALWNSVMLNTEDVKVAITANLSKQKPKFSKL
ncbi:ClpP/crotonase-like domain-containing protein [Chytridium lagenaria]|nr:ClpP/crotonase-like domain-containing protein [Chytridium lagenaria]